MPMAMLVMMALACLAVDAVAQDESPTMPGPEYTNAIAELLGYEHGPITTEAPRRAVSLFDSWTRTIVAPEFRPPADAPRLVHLGGGKACDTLSVSYLPDGREARIVQARFLFVMELQVEQELPATLETAQQAIPALLRRILCEAEKLNVGVHEMPGGFCGRQPSRPRLADGSWDLDGRNWTDTVHWWLSAGRLRLSCTKVQPHSSTLPNPGRRDNLEWLRFYEPRPQQ